MPATFQWLFIDEHDDFTVVAKPFKDRVMIEFVSGEHRVTLRVPEHVAETLGDRVIQALEEVRC